MPRRIFQRLRTRFDRWLARRAPRQRGIIRLHRRRVYILPTRGGVYFALLVFVMLLGAMNYSNSLGFALTFLLAGLGLVSMHHTHRNLVNLRLRCAHPEPQFAGRTAMFPIVLANPSATTRYSIRVGTGDDDSDCTLDVPAGGEAVASVRVPAGRRGWLPCPRLRIYTEYPMGLFRAWGWAVPDTACLVYPEPAGTSRLPAPDAGETAGRTAQQAGREDFAGLRRYAHGDPPRQIHWKVYSRTGQLMTKQFADPRERTLWLDAAALRHLPEEDRLSQLARWVLAAESAGAAYGLRLPGVELPPATGGGQRERALRALALYGRER